MTSRYPAKLKAVIRSRDHTNGAWGEGQTHYLALGNIPIHALMPQMSTCVNLTPKNHMGEGIGAAQTAGHVQWLLIIPFISDILHRSTQHCCLVGEA